MLRYQKGELYCECVPLRSLGEELGTPLYVYSWSTLQEGFSRVKRAFASLRPLIAYSVKANSNGALLRVLARWGAGFDVVSGGEFQRALRAGAPGEKIVFAGVGKQADELRLALKNKVKMFNVESVAELQALDRVAARLRVPAPVALRINPDVAAKTHKYMTTGKKENKFGINVEFLPEVLKEITALKNLKLTGLHCHIGSQILDPSTHGEALQRMRAWFLDIRAQGFPLRHLNIGGGFGIAYREEERPFPVERFAASVGKVLTKLDCKLILEPGRSIIGPAGALLTRVIYGKRGSERNFLIVDAALNDLLRPSLYSAYHRILPARQQKTPLVEMDVVGPICETGDFLGLGRQLPFLKEGEYLAILDAGAYGFTMSSNYNSRMRAAEVLVRGNRWYLIRRRERLNDLLRHEVIPDFLA